ncbi:MAG: hypothetical protein R3E57_02365 [Porticoccaceae bacterium]
MKKSASLNTLKTVVGLAFLSGSIAIPLVAQAENPFVANDIGSGYQLAAMDSEGKCGEGKCGEGKKTTKESEGKCGEGKCGEGKKTTKESEGKCGEGKCGEGKKTSKQSEGKCGEGKCGSK